MTIPLPNPLTTTETVLVALILLFFALWGWRHGLDAAILWGLFVVGGAWAAPILAPYLGMLINALVGMVLLITNGQFSMDNWTALIKAQYARRCRAGQCAGPQQLVDAAVNAGDLRHDLVHRLPHRAKEGGR